MTFAFPFDSGRAQVLVSTPGDLLEALHDGVVVCDLDGNVVSMNPAALQMHGFDDAAEAMRPLRDFHSNFALHYADGSLVPLEEWPLARVLRGETVSCFEAEMRRLNRPESLVVSYSGSLVYSGTGVPDAAVLTIRNVTRTNRLENELRNHEEERLLAFEAANLGAWRRNLDTEEIFLSPRAREQYGFPTGQLLHTEDIYQAIHQDDRERTRAAVDRAIDAHTVYETEYRVCHQDGSEHWLAVRGRASYGPQGRPLMLYGVALDITENRKAQEELLAVQRQFHHSQKLESLGVLAGGVAHDFNNLLTGILGNTSLMLDSIETNDPNRPLLEEVLKAGERAADLTRQLLAYAGKGKFVTRAIHLSDLVSEMNRLIRTSIPKNVHVAHHLPASLPIIEGDPSQIQQVVMNLILNAAEAIGKGMPGTVLIETGIREVDPPEYRDFFNADALRKTRYVSLDVHDTGCGMDEATRLRIFDPFFSTKFTGRGLGLSAVLGIVRGHRGALRVDSEKDAGTTFRVLFPAASQQPPPAAHPTRGKETVLAVGDCHDDIERLRDHGYAVLQCPDFRFAEAILREGQEPAAVVICADAEQPVDFAAAVHRYRPGVHVVLSSQLEFPQIIKKYPGHRFSAFVHSSGTAHELALTIRQVLSF